MEKRRIITSTNIIIIVICFATVVAIATQKFERRKILTRTSLLQVSGCRSSTNRFFVSKDALHLSVLSIFKDEAMNMQEWLEHYIWQGVEHFFLIDNGSSDNYTSKLVSYIEQGCVSLFKRFQIHSQVEHYNAIYNVYRNATEWMAVVDMDEFWFGTSQTLLEFLMEETNRNISCVYSHWRNFGSNNRTTHSPGSLRTTFTLADDKVLHPIVKGIARTKAITKLNVHQHEPLDSATIRTEDDKIRLNHYPIQSKEYFYKSKIMRGDVMYAAADTIRDWGYFESIDSGCNTSDEVLADLVRRHSIA